MNFWQKMRNEAARRKNAKEKRDWERHKLAWYLEDAIRDAYPSGAVRVEYQRQRYRVVQGPGKFKGRAFTVDTLMEQVRTLRCQAHVNRPSEVEA